VNPLQVKIRYNNYYASPVRKVGDIKRWSARHVCLSRKSGLSREEKGLGRLKAPRHRSSGVQATFSFTSVQNRSVQRSEIIRLYSSQVTIYAKDDSLVEDSLPLCELCLRASNHTKLKLSPYEIHMCRKLNVGMTAELSESAPKLAQDHQSYFG